MNSCAGVASKSQASSDGFLLLFFADRDYSSNASNNSTKLNILPSQIQRKMALCHLVHS